MAVLPSGESDSGQPEEERPQERQELTAVAEETEGAKSKRERALAYQQKFREAAHLRHVRLYEQAWEECLRRERLLARRDIEFSVQYNTSFGQEMRIIGSCPELGEWDVERSLPMMWTEGNIWVAKLALPRQAQRIEYKYIVREGPSKVRWESGNNHVVEVFVDGSAAAQQAQHEQSRRCKDSWGCGLG
mmetsp:Transcript_115344/g.331064  ORF Transcript_115344/g.331064 Transcript_115344/m.331064 type:complete len:189 (+) Transcript_115344:58-624(+)